MPTENHYSPILSRLQRCKRNRRGWESLCPVHEADGQRHRPSFFCQIGRTGALLVQCSACRCTVQQVADALCLRVSDFFPPLESFTNRNMSDQLKQIAEYDYFDENRLYVYTIVRYEPKTFRIKRKLGDGREEWGQGDAKTVLYRLPGLLESDPKRVVVVTEGEKCADRLSALGIIAITNPFGAGKWRPQFSDWLTARHAVIIADNDEPGERHAQEVANSLLGKAKSVKIVRFNGGYPEKADVTTFLEMGGTKEELQNIIKSVPLITEPFVIQPPAQGAPQNKPAAQPANEGPHTDDAPATDGTTRQAAPPNGSGGAAPGSGYEKKKVTLKRIVEVSNELPAAERVLIAQAILSGIAVELAK